MAMFKKPDVLIQFGSGYKRASILHDAVGRPFVLAHRNTPRMLFPDGKTDEYSHWIPLTPLAASIFKGET